MLQVTALLVVAWTGNDAVAVDVDDGLVEAGPC
jgi:hypothetical protein